jgi:hypothetical protein
MPEADVDYEGNELTSFAAAVAYSETTGREVYGGRGWNGKSQTKDGEVLVEWKFCQCPKHHMTIIITVSITAIINITTIATSITAA